MIFICNILWDSGNFLPTVLSEASTVRLTNVMWGLGNYSMFYVYVQGIGAPAV